MRGVNSYVFWSEKSNEIGHLTLILTQSHFWLHPFPYIMDNYNENILKISCDLITRGVNNRIFGMRNRIKYAI